MKKILTAITATVILATGATANTQKEHNIQISAGEFYDRTGGAITYKTPFNVLQGEVRNITYFKATAGFNRPDFNKGFFADFGVEDETYLIDFDKHSQFGVNSLGLKTVLKATSFSYDKEEITQRELKNGDFYFDSRNKIMNKGDLMAGVGLTYTEPYFYSKIEGNYNFGLFNEVKSEIELKYTVKNVVVSYKETKVDDEKFKSLNVGYQFTF